MTSFEKNIQSVLVKTVPLPSDTARDWEDVVQRAEAPKKTADAVRARRSTRSYLARRLVPVFVLAAAFIAVGLTAPWRNGHSLTGSAVAERALLAIGDGPVYHAVLNRETGWVYTDLASGRQKPTTMNTFEVWYDSERHLEREKMFDSEEQFLADPTSPTNDFLFTENAIWSQNGKLPQAPGQHFSVRAFPLIDALVDLRSAQGSARITGTGKVHGHDVIWIELALDRMNACPNAGIPCVERVAVDVTTSRPIEALYVELGPKPKIFAAYYVVSIETLPAGSGDFSIPKLNPTRIVARRYDQVTSITPSEAAEALPGALWLGESFSGLQLSIAIRATLTAKALSAKSTETGVGIELHYGNSSAANPRISVGNRGVFWSDTSTANQSGGDYVVLQETGKRSLSLGGLGFTGGLLTRRDLTDAGVNADDNPYGWVLKDGTYVFISASSRALLLEAARALEPIQP